MQTTNLHSDADTTPPKPERCGTCRYWRPSGKRLPRGYSQPGRCRRRAPSAASRFPEISNNQWCGEWQPGG